MGLSTQYLVDCMPSMIGVTCTGGVKGCCGGNPLSAIQWLSETGGLPTQAAYGDVIEPGRRAQAGPVSHTGHGITYSGNNPTTVYPCKTGIPKTVLPKTA